MFGVEMVVTQIPGPVFLKQERLLGHQMMKAAHQGKMRITRLRHMVHHLQANPIAFPCCLTLSALSSFF